MATLTLNMSPTPSPTRTSRPASDLTLDLSDLPALTEPTPPSNTLLITNLQSLEIFTPANLASIRRAIDAHAPVHTFSPLKALRRIIVTFRTVDAALTVRRQLDGESVLGARVRVYFGQPTRVNPTYNPLGGGNDSRFPGPSEMDYLRAPPSAKLFLISPPPSPPVGWEMRNEEPPNREVHAEDLAVALARLHARSDAADERAAQMDLEDAGEAAGRMTHGGDGAGVGVNGGVGRRSRSTTLVFDPADHGGSIGLPAIAVEDTSASPGDWSPMEGVEKKFVHTSRPPVELMET